MYRTRLVSLAVAHACSCRYYATQVMFTKHRVRTIPCVGVTRLRRSITNVTCTSSSSSSKSITFVRHGQSTWNAEGRIQGSSNFSVLTSKGKDQAGMTRDMVRDMEFDICLRSPLARASETADIVWAGRTPGLVDVSDLREIDLYAFEGLLKAEGVEKFGAQFDKWKKQPEEFEIDGHYPVRELWDRATVVWENVLLRQPHSKILVVAHNAVNQAILGSALGFGPHYFRRLLQSNCALSKVSIGDDFKPNTGRGIEMEFFNQTPKSPLDAKKAVVGLICGPASIDEEALITNTIIHMLQKSNIKRLMFSSTGASARLAQKILDSKNNLSFETHVVETVEEILSHLKSTDDVGASIVIHDKKLCQDFMAHSLDLNDGSIFKLSPGGLSVLNMTGGPVKNPIAICINHHLHLDEDEPDVDFI